MIEKISVTEIDKILPKDKEITKLNQYILDFIPLFKELSYSLSKKFKGKSIIFDEIIDELFLLNELFLNDSLKNSYHWKITFKEQMSMSEIIKSEFQEYFSDVKNMVIKKEALQKHKGYFKTFTFEEMINLDKKSKNQKGKFKFSSLDIEKYIFKIEKEKDNFYIKYKNIYLTLSTVRNTLEHSWIPGKIKDFHNNYLQLNTENETNNLYNDYYYLYIISMCLNFLYMDFLIGLINDFLLQKNNFNKILESLKFIGT